MTIADMDNATAVAWLTLSISALIYAMHLAAKSWRMFLKVAAGILFAGLITHIIRTYA